jgi:outer membrane protein OmpA-like peptidoglycan-associated protein/Mg-chelatase subunit ChlD
MLNRTLFFLILIFLSCAVNAQTDYLVSDNSNFFVATSFNGKSERFHIDIYSVARNRLLRRISAPVERKKEIRKVQIGPDARFLALYLKHSVQVWDVASAYMVAEYTGSEEIMFVEGAPSFFIMTSQPRGLYLFDHSALGKKRLRFADRNGYKKVIYEPGLGCYFIQGEGGILAIIRVSDKRLIKRIRCSDFSVDALKKELTVYGTSRTVMRKVYQLPTMIRTDKQVPSQEVLSYIISNDLIKSERIRLQFPQVCHAPNNSKGAFIAEGKGQYFLFIYDYRTEAVLYAKELKDIEKSAELLWIGNEKVRLVSEGQWLVEYEWDGEIWRKNIGDKFFANPDLKWDTYAKQKDHVFWSRYHTYGVLHQKSWLKKDDFIVKENMYRNQDIRYPKSELLAFSPNEQYLFFRKDSAFGYVALEKGWDEIYYFSSNLKLQDPIIPYDTLAPDSFYLALGDEVDLNKSKELEPRKLFANLQSIGMDEERVAIKVQILDSSGNIYTGLNQDNIKKVWCEMYLKKDLGMPEQMKALRIREKDESDTSGVNVALVSDYSGSMGPINTARLEKGVKGFIEEKTKKDRITILKYDTKIKKDVANDEDKESLLKSYNETKYSEMGGGTSLLDAANKALDVMKKKKNAENLIFLLTDGYENSSMATVSEVIVKAKKMGIEIHTIGIGFNLNLGMLQTIAVNTGGSFTHCSNPANLNFIYRDLKRKIQTSYTISFDRPKEKVKYTLYVRLCHPACDTCASDFQKFEFDNAYETIDLNSVDITDDEAFTVFAGRENVKEEELNEIATFDNDSLNLDFGVDTDEVFEQDSSYIDLDSLEQSFEAFELPRFEFKLDTNLFVMNYDSALQKVAAFLLEYPQVIIEVQGHTDDTGSKKRNKYLSNIRAQKVAEMLISLGAKPEQIRTVGFGEDKPLYPNISSENRALNRRIEFELLSGI